MTVAEQDKIVIKHGEWGGILEIDVNNLERILQFESGLHLYTSSQKHMLVPESIH